MSAILYQVLTFVLCANLISTSPTKEEYVTKIDVDLNKNQVYRGFLSEGRTIDVEWANNATNVNCFPKKENKSFNGNQLLYTVMMPAYTQLELKAISNEDISMYAFQIDEGDLRNLPPKVNKVIHCQSSVHKGNGSKDPELIYLSTQSKPNKVIIGIAGVKKIDRGAFDLYINLTERPKP